MTLSRNQIDIILLALDNSVKYADSEYIEEVDGIFQELEGSVDRFYDNMEKKQKAKPTPEWTD